MYYFGLFYRPPISDSTYFSSNFVNKFDLGAFCSNKFKIVPVFVVNGWKFKISKILNFEIQNLKHAVCI